MRQRYYEQGVASIFIVVFSILLLIVVSISFTQLMMSEQIRSNDTELSQGAYDSALSGVEDGKRVLALCQQSGYDPSNVACQAILKGECTTVSDAGIVSQENGEVYIKTTSNGGKDFEQAYTCVKISLDSPEYKGTIDQSGDSTVIPLRGVSAFDKVQLFWRVPSISQVSDLGSAIYLKLPQASAWSAEKPPVIRSQLIQYKDGSLLSSDFDSNNNSHTTYFYPTTGGVAGSPALTNFSVDQRRSGFLSPTAVGCTTLLVQQGYNCWTTISLPDPIGGDSSNRVAYLRLMSIYNGADYMVRLVSSTGSTVKFFRVQPSIDSTGRASDVFRRVEAKVELTDSNEASLYPRATVDLTNNLCKTMIVSIDPVDYSDGGCTP